MSYFFSKSGRYLTVITAYFSFRQKVTLTEFVYSFSSSGSSGRMGGTEKNEIYTGAFGDHLFTGRNEFVAKVMFLLACVILFTISLMDTR